MRGAMLIVILISLLIVAMLVMKNIGGQKSATTRSGGSTIESMDRAREAAGTAQKKLDAIRSQSVEGN